MASGGRRAGSGPAPAEGSARSDRRGYKLEALPAEPFTGEVPAFSLPDARPRELALWAEVWRMPQAHAWSRPSERWRVRNVAMWVRLSVRCEAEDASASLLAQLHRFADQAGLTDSGLASMGWKIAPPEELAEQSMPRRPRRLRAAPEAHREAS